METKSGDGYKQDCSVLKARGGTLALILNLIVEILISYMQSTLIYIVYLIYWTYPHEIVFIVTAI